MAYMTMWGLNLLYPLPMLSMLTVPGVTRKMTLPDGDIGMWIATSVVMGLWYWYIRIPVRAMNTLVNWCASSSFPSRAKRGGVGPGSTLVAVAAVGWADRS